MFVTVVDAFDFVPDAPSTATKIETRTQLYSDRAFLVSLRQGSNVFAIIAIEEIFWQFI